MNNTPQKQAIRCTEESVTTHGFVMRRDLESSERLARGAKLFGGFFLVALLTVFIPILHFVLPPLLLLVGGVLAVNEYSSTGEVLSGEIACPNCKKKIEFQRESEGWPREQRCRGCSFTLKFVKES